MGKELCFCIEGKNLYLEQILVDYENIPIFFLCKHKNQYYIALCTDMEEFHYIVVAVADLKIYDLLHGKCPMRNIFLESREYWEILSGEEISMDDVKKHATTELDISVLPEDKACFQVLTEGMRLFVQNFDNMFFHTEFVTKEEEDIDFLQVSVGEMEQMDARIQTFTDLGNAYFKMPIKGKQEPYESFLGKYMPYFERMATVQENEIIGAKNWGEDDTVFVAV